MKNRLLYALLVAAGILPGISQAASYVYRMPQTSGLHVTAVASGSEATGVGGLSAGSVSFAGTTVVGFPSATQTVQYSNTSANPLHITAIALTGPFTASHNCPYTLAAGAACQLAVTYIPTAVGPQSGTLAVTTDAGASGSATLSGTGVQGALAFNPVALDFGKVAVGNHSPLTFATTNKGSSTSQILTITKTEGPFELGSRCTLAAMQANSGNTCESTLTFSPTSPGDYSGYIEVADNQGNTGRVPFKGSASNPGDASFSQASFTFPPLPAGSDSMPQTVTLTNTGAVPLDISDLTLTGPFTMSSSCASTLAPNASCDIDVVYHAGMQGYQSGVLTLTSPLMTGSRRVTFSGTSQEETLVMSNSDWATVAGKQTKVFSVTNTGTLDAHVATVELSGDAALSQTNTCEGASLAAGGSNSCTVTVTINPTSSGALKPTYVKVTDSNGKSASGIAVLNVSGLETASTAPYGKPASVLLGYQPVGKTATATVTLMPGTTPVDVTAITVEGDSQLTASQNCVGKTVGLDAGSCVVTLTYTATQSTALAESLVKVAYSGGTLSIPVSAGVIVPSPSKTATLSPNNLSFDAALVGSTASATKTATFTNTSSVAINVFGVTTQSPDFSATHNCPASLAPNATCTVTVSFKPTSIGALTGSLAVTSDAGSAGTTALSGTGQGEDVITGSLLAFGAVDVLSPATSKTLTVTNNGNVGATVTGVTLLGDSQYSLGTNACANASLAPGQACSISVAYTPTKVGVAQAMLQLTTLAGRSASANVTGTGLSIGKTSVSTQSLQFGSQRVGTTSAAQSVLFSNTGTVPVAISTINSAQAFPATHNCPSSLAVGANCTVSVSFAPSSTSADTGTLTFKTDGAMPLTEVALSGTSVSPSLSLSSSSLSFNAAALAAGTPATLVVTNKGTAPAVITNVGVQGDRFTSATDCVNKTLAVGGTDSCAINVTYTPTAFDVADTGSIVISESGSQVATVSLAGSAHSATPVFSVNGTTATTLPLGRVQSYATGSATVTLSNSGAELLTVSDLRGNGLTVSGCAGGTQLAQGQTCTATVSYTPGLVTAETPETHNLVLFYNGGKTATLSVTDTPYGGWLSASSTTYAFGGSNYGSTYQSTAITLTNRGTQPVHLDAANVSQLTSNSTDVSASHDCGSTMAAGASCTIIINYTPSSGTLPAGTHVVLKSDGLQTQTGGSRGDIIIDVTGSPNAGVLTTTANPLPLTVAPYTSITQDVTVTNSGQQPISLGTPSITGTSAARFGYNLNGCSVILAGSSCLIKVTYTPSGIVTSPADTAELALPYTGGPTSPLKISLSGTTDTSHSDPYWSNVVTLQNMDGAFTDLKGAVTFASTAGATTTSASKFGAGAATFSQFSSKITATNYPTLTGDFTVEFWANFGALSWRYGYASLLSLGTYGAAGGVTFAVSGSYIGLINQDATGFVAYALRGTQGAWHHVALSRKSGVTRFFYDGVLVADVSSQFGTAAVNNEKTFFANAISGYSDAGPTSWSMDDVRITKGVGRYTTNFSVPTAAFANY